MGLIINNSLSEATKNNPSFFTSFYFVQDNPNCEVEPIRPSWTNVFTAIAVILNEVKDLRMLLLFFLLFLAFNSLPAQEINWTTFEELPQKMREEPKPILVFIHTDWCKYCKMQEKNTFSDSLISERLNKQFYLLKLNAEKAAEIQFLNRTYTKGNNDYHPLAELLGKENGELIFPTTVFLSPQFQPESRFVGFLSKEVMSEFLINLQKDSSLK